MHVADVDSGDTLARVVDLLWPDAVVTASDPPKGTERSYRLRVFPDPSAPRLFLPVTGRRASARVAAASSSTTSRVLRLSRGVLAATAGTARTAVPGALVTIAGADGHDLTTRLREATGLPVAALTVRLGSPRPNRKPVLVLHAVDGRCLGFGKVGWTPLTRSLVRHEGDTLVRLSDAPFRVIRVPRVLARLEWGPASVLVLEYLRGWPRRHPPVALLCDAVRDLTETLGSRRAVLGTSGYAQRLGKRVDCLAPSPEARRLADGVTRMLEVHGDRELRFARWHGDFRPWNMAPRRGRLGLWDWERSSSDVPVGLDLVHFHHAARRGSIARPADGPTTAPRRLGLDGAAAPALRACHLVELALRYLGDADGEPDTGRTAALLDALDTVV